MRNIQTTEKLYILFLKRLWHKTQEGNGSAAHSLMWGQKNKTVNRIYLSTTKGAAPTYDIENGKKMWLPP